MRDDLLEVIVGADPAIVVLEAEAVELLREEEGILLVDDVFFTGLGVLLLCTLLLVDVVLTVGDLDEDMIDDVEVAEDLAEEVLTEDDVETMEGFPDEVVAVDVVEIELEVDTFTVVIGADPPKSMVWPPTTMLFGTAFPLSSK